MVTDASLECAPGEDGFLWNWDFTAEDLFLTDLIASAEVTDWEGAAFTGFVVGSPAFDAPNRLVQTAFTDLTAGLYRLRLVAISALGRRRPAFLKLLVTVPDP